MSATALLNGNGIVPTSGQSTEIRLKPIAKATAIVPVQGVTPVIPHKWSAKALRMMQEAQSGTKVKAKHDAKDPVEEAEGSTYYLDDGRVGLPAVAFKAAIVRACDMFEGITMAKAKRAFFVEGEGVDQLVAFEYGERTLREDTPRNSNGNADLRYRYSYFPWQADLLVTFLPNMIDLDSLVALVNAAGFGGVGDWRPSAPKSSTGTFGRFEVNAEAGVHYATDDDGR